MKRVYLDYSATTPIDPEVKEAIVESLELYGNPSSHYELGREAKQKIEAARANVAKFINAEPREIIFTSGGSESNNIVLRSLLCCGQNCTAKWTPHSLAEKMNRPKIITSSIEHPSVLETCRLLKCESVDTHFLPVDGYGIVCPETLEAAIDENTCLVSIMQANNEVGTVEPIRELAGVARKHGVLFHTDAVQSATKVPIDVKELNVDYLSLSGHKMYAPKGVGILYVRQGLSICPLISGGHQETGIRAGTENTLGIIAMGKAAEIAMRDQKEESERIGRLRDKLEKGLLNSIPDCYVNGHPEHRVPNMLNISFAHIEGEAILYMLDHEGIEVSTGSACSSGSLDPSPVLTAMNLEIGRIHSSIRMSLGKYTTEEEIDYVLEKFPPIVQKLRRMSPFA